MRKTVEVQMDAGMEARPIALMVQTANQFSSHLSSRQLLLRGPLQYPIAVHGSRSLFIYLC